MKNLPNITSIRFFLAIIVVIYHIPEFSANRGFPSFNDLAVFRRGTEAVYMFFSLSGFLIIRNLFDEKTKTGTISLKKFYKRRILRIFPLYYAVLVFGLFYYNIILPKLGFEIEPRQYSIEKGLILGGTFFSNILAVYSPGGILEILWSIGIEEQFYLFIAPILLLLPTKKILHFLVLFSLVYFAMYNSNRIDILGKYKMLFYFFSTSGAIAVLTATYPKVRLGLVPKVIVFGLFIFYFCNNFFVDHLSDVMYQLFSMILFSVFIFCIIQTPYKILEYTKLKYLGKISYGIYMLHAIVMQIVGFIFLKINTKFNDLNPVIFILSFNLLTIILTIFFSHLSYKYYESFFLKFNTSKVKNNFSEANNVKI